MNRPEIDPERVAALLDGRLDARARAALLAELTRDEETAEEFADILEMVRDMERLERDDPSIVGVITPQGGEGRRQRGRGRWWLGLAAAVVVAVIGGRVATRGEGRAADPASYVALLDQRGAMPEPFAWSGTRGVGDPLTPEARAVRFGVRATELELARRAGDREAAARAAQAMATLLADVPGSAPVAATYRRAAADSAAPAELRSAWSTSLALLGAAEVRSGAWLAAARAAAARRDAAYFRDAANRRVVRELVARLPAAESAAAERIERAAAAESVPWDALGRDVDALLTASGR